MRNSTKEKVIVNLFLFLRNRDEEIKKNTIELLDAMLIEYRITKREEKKIDVYEAIELFVLNDIGLVKSINILRCSL